MTARSILETAKKGKSSWRCKECHGWDYLGKDGRYRSGSHFTGFDGILHARGKTEEALGQSLSGGRTGHDFSTWLSPAQIRALTVFIREGLIDFQEVEKKLQRSSGGQGRALYGKACASCHGDAGNDIDFKDKDGVQGVGWLARDNPQETLHKIRWGHPGSDMPSAVVNLSLTDEETVEILHYARTLDQH
jgi:cytochrome c553